MLLTQVLSRVPVTWPQICASLGFKAQIRWIALCPCNSAVLLLSLKPCFIHLQISSWFISSQITIISIDSGNSLPKSCLFLRHLYFCKSISYYRVCWKTYNSAYLSILYTAYIYIYWSQSPNSFPPTPPWCPYIGQTGGSAKKSSKAEEEKLGAGRLRWLHPWDPRKAVTHGEPGYERTFPFK